MQTSNRRDMGAPDFNFAHKILKQLLASYFALLDKNFLTSGRLSDNFPANPSFADNDAAGFS